MPPRLALVDQAAQVRLALSPVRREILTRLQTPGSAATLALAMDRSRQQIGHHVRALEAAGLLTLVEERPRRGFTERVLVASAEAFIVDPSVLGDASPATDDAIDAQDRHAAGHLVRTASDVVREVTRMSAEADREGRRLLTFTVEAELRFALPGDLERFSDRLAAAVADLAAEFAPQSGGRRYRLVAGAHPAPLDRKPPTRN